MATRLPGRTSRRLTGHRDRPFLNSNFTVTLEPPGSVVLSIGFCEVILPELPVRRQAKASATDSVTVVPRLVLRRGFDGTAVLRDWWMDTRRRKTPRPWTVTVCLLAEDRRTVVATWIFTGARPVSLAYSPLHASEASVLVETVALGFENVELR